MAPTYDRLQYIIRRTSKPRMKSKLYLFNSFGMLSKGTMKPCRPPEINNRFSPILRGHSLELLFVGFQFWSIARSSLMVALNLSRFAVYDRACKIGMKRVAMIPLIAFDILVNVCSSLCSLRRAKSNRFTWPRCFYYRSVVSADPSRPWYILLRLKALYSYQNNPSAQTRKVALRTFIGSCCTLTSSVV